jgi:hypothetical protein
MHKFFPKNKPILVAHFLQSQTIPSSSIFADTSVIVVISLTGDGYTEDGRVVTQQEEAWTLRAARHLVCGPNKVGLVRCQPVAISEPVQEVVRPAAISSKHGNICLSVTQRAEYIQVRSTPGATSFARSSTKPRIGNMTVRDSTLVFVNLEFHPNISDKQLPASCTEKPPSKLKQIYTVAPL